MSIQKRYLLLLSLIIGLLFSSCFKVEETVATVRVLNEANTPIPGASVRLYFQGNDGEARFDTIQFTNGSGIASFNFSEDYEAGQSGFAVLNIDVTKGSLLGSGIIKIEEQEVTEETVIID